MNRISATLVLSVFANLPSTGCVPAVYRVEYDEVETTREPPPSRLEPIPEPPGPSYVWVDGYWYWTGLDFIWLAGYWSLPPVVDHVWVPSGWVHWNGRYRYVPGRWAPPHRVPHHHYVPPRPSRPSHPPRPPHRPHEGPPPRRP